MEGFSAAYATRHLFNILIKLFPCMCSWFAGASNGPTSWRTKYLHANAVNVLRPVPLQAPMLRSPCSLFRFLAGIRAGNLEPDLDSRWSHYHPHLTLIKLLCVLKCLFSICVRISPAPSLEFRPPALLLPAWQLLSF